MNAISSTNFLHWQLGLLSNTSFPVSPEAMASLTVAKYVRTNASTWASGVGLGLGDATGEAAAGDNFVGALSDFADEQAVMPAAITTPATTGAKRTERHELDLTAGEATRRAPTDRGRYPQDERVAERFQPLDWAPCAASGCAASGCAASGCAASGSGSDPLAAPPAIKRVSCEPTSRLNLRRGRVRSSTATSSESGVSVRDSPLWPDSARTAAASASTRGMPSRW